MSLKRVPQTHIRLQINKLDLYLLKKKKMNSLHNSKFHSFIYFSYLYNINKRDSEL